jgi:histidyl-tRNA synthetase
MTDNTPLPNNLSNLNNLNMPHASAAGKSSQSKPTQHKLQGVKGMNDLLPDQSPLQEALEDTVRQVFRSYGYRLIRTPIVEPTGLFVRGLGEVTDIVEKEMYSFTDALNGDSLTLRPEGTAGVVRSAIEHNWLYNGPQRVWTMGPMYRHERPQKGRYREFYQFSVEAMGFEGPDVEAEQIIMLARLWRALGITDVALHINSIGDASERAVHRAQLIAYFEANLALLDEEAKRRLHSNPLRILDTKNPAMQALVNAAPKLMDFLGEASRAHFEALKALISAAGIAFTINPRLVRGMDYYNRSVFEWVSGALGSELTITGGGRYDGLFEQLGGKPTPACGFGLGLERVVLVWQASIAQAAQLAAQQAVAAGGASAVPAEPANLHRPAAYIVHSGQGTAPAASALGEQLRDAQIACVLHAGGGSFKSQLKKADVSGARFTIILGENELASGQVALKNMATGEQNLCTTAQLIAALSVSAR